MKETSLKVLRKYLNSWSRGLPRPYPETELTTELHKEFTSVASVFTIDQSPLDNVLSEFSERCHRDNAKRISDSIRLVCSKELEVFCCKEAEARLESKSVTECFEDVIAARAVFDAEASRLVGILDEWKKLVRVDIIVDEFEQKMVRWYAGKHSGLAGFVAKISDIVGAKVKVSALSFEELDQTLARQLERCKLEVWQELRFSVVPITIRAQINREIDNCAYTKVGCIMKSQFLRSMHSIVDLQLTDLFKNNRELFSGIHMQNEAIWLILTIINRENWGNPSLKATFKNVFGLFEEQYMPADIFVNISQRLKSELNLESKCFLAVSLFLVFANILSTPDSRCFYSAPNRLLYRKVLQSLLFSVDSQYFTTVVEERFAEYSFYEKTPSLLVSHMPDESLLQLSSFGESEYYRKATQSLAAAKLDLMTGQMMSMISCHPEMTHSPLRLSMRELGRKGVGSVVGLGTNGGQRGEVIEKGFWMEYEVESLGVSLRNAGTLAKQGSSCASHILGSSLAGMYYVSGLLGYCQIAAKVVSFIYPGKMFVDLGLFLSPRRKEICKFAGVQLAELVRKQAYGQGPVSLIGYEVTCMIIYYCLKELHDRPGPPRIQDILLISGLVKNHPTKWGEKLSSVYGRIINVYSLNLSLTYRFAGGWSLIAGTPLECNRVENVEIQGQMTVEEVLARVKMQT